MPSDIFPIRRDPPSHEKYVGVFFLSFHSKNAGALSDTRKTNDKIAQFTLGKPFAREGLQNSPRDRGEPRDSRMMAVTHNAHNNGMEFQETANPTKLTIIICVR